MSALLPRADIRNPRVRRIAGHDPDTLPEVEYYRQIFWSSGMDLPDDLAASLAEFTIDH